MNPQMPRVLSSILLFMVLGAAPSLRADQAAAHLGETRTVCGKVASTKYVPSANHQPTFLNLDKPYPKQIFTIVIFGKDRGRFSVPPEQFYSGTRVCVTGKITLFNSIPETVVEHPSQIRVVKQP